MLKNKLKSWRHKMEMNQTEFAEFIEEDRHTYNRWELQKVQPSLEKALKISEKLGITVNEIFEIIPD